MLFDDEKKQSEPEGTDTTNKGATDKDSAGENTASKEEQDGDDAAAASTPEALAAIAKKRKKQVLLIVIGVVILIIAIAGGAYFFLKNKNSITTEAGLGALTQEQQSGKQIYFRQLDEIIVNLNTEDRTTSFMKLKITLELEGSDNLNAVNNMLPRINDIMQVYLRELRPQDMQGSLGLYRLREELLLRINKILYPAKVNNILFDQVLIQ